MAYTLEDEDKPFLWSFYRKHASSYTNRLKHLSIKVLWLPQAVLFGGWGGGTLWGVDLYHTLIQIEDLPRVKVSVYATPPLNPTPPTFHLQINTACDGYQQIDNGTELTQGQLHNNSKTTLGTTHLSIGHRWLLLFYSKPQCDCTITE